MNDKERLEQMEQDYKNAFPINIEWLLDYAKEQAERVAELEEVVKHNFKHHKHQQEMIFDLEQQNRRYRGAIEYVINAKVNQYASLENIINDLKFVLSEALEESE